jgi:hypothetical protein
VLTGYSSNVGRVREQAGRLRRATRVLTKPCNPIELLREAGRVLAAA